MTSSPFEVQPQNHEIIAIEGAKGPRVSVYKEMRNQDFLQVTEFKEQRPKTLTSTHQERVKEPCPAAVDSEGEVLGPEGQGGPGRKDMGRV